MPSVEGWAEMSLGPSGPSFKSSGGIIWDPFGENPGYVLGLGYVFGFGAARWLSKTTTPTPLL